MKPTVNIWKEMACLYGTFFGLRAERILSARKTKDMYELYYRDEKESIEMIYVESQTFQTFYHLLKEEGWEDVFVGKYLNTPDQVPAFLLKARKNDYNIHYHFAIKERIIIEAYAYYNGEAYQQFGDMDEHAQNDIRNVHRMVEAYVFARYKHNIALSEDLYQFMNGTSITHEEKESEGLQNIRSDMAERFLYCTNELERSVEYATNAILTMYKKRFQDPVTQVMVWWTLKELNEQWALQENEDKTALLNWLQQEYRRAKESLNEDQRQYFEKNGLTLP